MNAKGLTVAASVLVGIAVLIIAVMAVGSVHLGADRTHLTPTQYAARVAAADQLDAQIHALATDVPPDLPVVPARLARDASAGATAALPAVSRPSDDDADVGDDGDREEGEDWHGEPDD